MWAHALSSLYYLCFPLLLPWLYHSPTEWIHLKYGKTHSNQFVSFQKKSWRSPTTGCKHSHLHLMSPEFFLCQSKPFLWFLKSFSDLHNPHLPLLIHQTLLMNVHRFTCPCCFSSWMGRLVLFTFSFSSHSWDQWQSSLLPLVRRT